jgi:hypothetical protein
MGQTALYGLVAALTGAWLVGTISAVVALVLAILNPARHFALLVILAAVALIVGFLGFGHGVPISSIPQLGFTYSRGDFEYSLSSSWFFIAPLLLGPAAVFVAVTRRKWLAKAV